MQLELTEDERAFRDEMREFFTTKVSEETRETVAAGRELTKDQLVESMRTLNAAGLAVPRWPVEWGGQDWTEIQFHLWREEMERACVPTPLAFNAGMIGPVIAQFGTEEQKKEFLPKTANIDIFWSQGFSEPDAGSDLAGLRTTAVKDGDDWVVNGQKTWTTLGQYGDWIFTLVRTDPDAKKQAGISMLLIDMESEGLEVRPIQLIDGGHEVNEVWFDDVRVPGREPRRRAQRRLVDREVPARQRAGRRRAVRASSSGWSAGSRGWPRTGSPTTRCSAPGSPSWRTSCWRSS